MTVINPGGAGGANFTQGTLAARPAPTPNALYYANDTGEWFIANAAGNAWQSIAATSAAALAVNGVNLGAGTSNPVEWGVAGPAFESPGGGQMHLNSASLDIATLGQGLQVKEGANAKQGTGTLVAGAVTVANTSVTATSRIFITSNADGGAPGFLRVSARVAGTSFTVTSSSNTDTSTFAYQIFEPG